MELADVDTLPVETTLYSLSEQAPAPPDRREDQRHLTLYRVGTILLDGVRELCLIKNISAGGLMLRAYRPVHVGQQLQVELKAGQPLSGTGTWVLGPQIGITLDEPIDVIAILSSSMDGPRPRMPRIETSSFVQVRDGAKVIRARACDISQGGLKIASKASLAAGTEIVVLLPKLAPQPGVVCWTTGDFIGLTFNRLVPLPTLVDWLQGQHVTAQAA